MQTKNDLRQEENTVVGLNLVKVKTSRMSRAKGHQIMVSASSSWRKEKRGVKEVVQAKENLIVRGWLFKENERTLVCAKTKCWCRREGICRQRSTSFCIAQRCQRKLSVAEK